MYEIDKLPSESRKYFKHLFKIQSHDFLKASKITKIKANERFVYTGENLQQIWICISGVVKVMEEFKSGETYIFTRFTAPEIFGEMEALAQIPKFRASLVAETNCIFIVGPVDAYIKWLKNDNSLLYERTQYLLKNVMDEGRSNRAYLLLNSTERIKLYFLDHCKFAHGEKLCVIRNTRQEIADETGYSVKTVNRAIKKLSEQGLIVVDGQRIKIGYKQYGQMLESIDEKVRYE